MDIIEMMEISFNFAKLEDSPVGFTSFIVLSTFAVTTMYYIFAVARKPTIYTSNMTLQQFLENNVASVNEKYFPNYLVWEGRLQSILGLNLRLPDSHFLPYIREVIKLKDGGEIGLDFIQPDVVDKNSLLVFLLPGLTSSSQTCYVKTLVLSILSTGSIVAVLNNRGIGGVPIKTPRLYSASNCEDVEEVILYLKKKYPTFRKIAIGTSMGAMVICKYLTSKAEEAKETFLAVLTISSLWDAAIGVLSLEKPYINRYIINKEITSSLQELAMKYKDVLEVREYFDFKKISQCSNIRDFDTNFTAPQFGFKTALEYYEDCSSWNKISEFSVPVFALNAEDDPFAPVEALPKEQALAPGSNFVLVTTARGGHLGYLEGYLPIRKKEHFMERFVADFCRAVKLRSNELL